MTTLHEMTKEEIREWCKDKPGVRIVKRQDPGPHDLIECLVCVGVFRQRSVYEGDDGFYCRVCAPMYMAGWDEDAGSEVEFKLPKWVGTFQLFGGNTVLHLFEIPLSEAD